MSVNPAEGREQRLAAAGLKKVDDKSCPRRLVRRHCKRNECWCRTPANDHGATYRDTRGRYRVIWEPYSLSHHEMSQILTGCWDDGVAFYISGGSVYFPNRTMTITFYHRSEEET